MLITTRRQALHGLIGTTLTAASGIPAFAAGKGVLLYKTSICGCCSLWGAQLGANGFTVKEIIQDDLGPIKIENKVPPELVSCHTALVDGYVIEGHVPLKEITRLLDERPRAIGLAVPGMPLGSAGMEQPDGYTEPYEVMLFGLDGTQVFASCS